MTTNTNAALRGALARLVEMIDAYTQSPVMAALQEHITMRQARAVLASAAQPPALTGDLAEPRDDSDRIYDRPVGYLPAYELSRLHSGHGAQLRSAKFGPSALDGDVPVYLESSALALVQALIGAQRAINSMKAEAETAAQGDEQMMLDACEQISNEGLEASLAIQAALSTAAQPLTQDEQENQLCMSSASCGQASTNESAFITSTQRSAGTFSASSERQSYRDSDGMPTERAVLEREWRRMKIALSATAAQPPADGALNTIAAMFHSGEEIEGPDGLAMMVDMSVWNDALDAFEGIIGDEMEPAKEQA